MEAPSKNNPPTWDHFQLIIKATMEADGRVVTHLTQVSEHLKRGLISPKDCCELLDSLCDEILDSLARRGEAID